MDRSEWALTIGSAVAEDALDELMCTPGVLAQADWAALYKGLRASSGPDARRWADLLGTVGIDRQTAAGLWPVALAAGWAGEKVAGLGALVAAELGTAASWTLSWAVGRGDQVQAVIRNQRPTALMAVTLHEGTVLAIGDEGVTLWDLATGEQLGDGFATETGAVLGMCVLRWPDGRDLLAICDAAWVLRLWDPQTRQPVGPPMTGVAVPNHPNTGRPEFVRGMVGAHAADGRPLLAVAGDNVVRIWDATDGSMLGEVVPQTQYGIEGMAAYPRPGRQTWLAVVVFHEDIHLIDPERLEVVGAPRSDPDGRASTTIPLPWPDGRLLVLSGFWTGEARLWDAMTGARVCSTIVGHTTYISSAIPLPHSDGRVLLATGSDDRTVRVWDPVSGQPVGDALVGHGRKLYHLTSATGADGRAHLVSSSQDYTVRVWQPVNEAGAGPAHCGDIRGVCVLDLAEEGVLVATAAADDTVRRWDAATGGAVGDVMAAGPVHAICPVVRSDGRVLLATAGDGVRLWDPVSGQLAGKPLTTKDSARSVCTLTLPDGRVLLAAGFRSDHIRIWDTSTGRAVRRISIDAANGVWAVAEVRLPDGRVLLAAGDGDDYITLWDPVAGRRVANADFAHGSVGALATVSCTDGRVALAAGLRRGPVWMFDLADVEVDDPAQAWRWHPRAESLGGDQGQVRALAVLPDAGLLLSGGLTATVEAWDHASYEHVGTLPMPAPVTSLAALPDGRVAVAAGRFLVVARPPTHS
jgi:WD40 repeat protein